MKKTSFKLQVGTTQNFTSSYYFLVIFSLKTQTELHHLKRKASTAPGEPPQLLCEHPELQSEPPQLHGKPWQPSIAPGWPTAAPGWPAKVQDDFHGLGKHSRFDGEPPQLQEVVSIVHGESPLLQGELRLLLGELPMLRLTLSGPRICHNSGWASMAPGWAFKFQGEPPWLQGKSHSSGWAFTVPGWTSIAPGMSLNESLAILNCSRLIFNGSRSEPLWFRIRFHGSRVSLHGSRMSLHGSEVNLSVFKLNLCISRDEPQWSRLSFQDSRVSLQGSRMSLRSSRMSFNSFRESIFCPRIDSTAPGRALLCPGWPSISQDRPFQLQLWLFMAPDSED